MRVLYRSNKNRIIAGVCGGIAEYFNIDPVIIRVLWIFFSMFGGAGLILYIIGWIVIPDAKSKLSLVEEWSRIKDQPNSKQAREIQLIIGLFILFLGVTLLFNNLGWFNWSWSYTLSIGLIAAGVIIILSRRGR